MSKKLDQKHYILLIYRYLNELKILKYYGRIAVFCKFVSIKLAYENAKSNVIRSHHRL